MGDLTMPVVTIAEIDERLRHLPPDKLIVVCQITSQAVGDSYAVPLTDRDFTSGSLRQASLFAPIASLRPSAASSCIGLEH
jgi:hypothetical protein